MAVEYRARCCSKATGKTRFRWLPGQQSTTLLKKSSNELAVDWQRIGLLRTPHVHRKLCDGLLVILRDDTIFDEFCRFETMLDLIKDKI